MTEVQPMNNQTRTYIVEVLYAHEMDGPDYGVI